MLNQFSGSIGCIHNQGSVARWRHRRKIRCSRLRGHSRIGLGGSNEFKYLANASAAGADMEQFARRRSRYGHVLAGALALNAVATTPTVSLADEGGVSFWVPGFISSLAATPLVPGFSMAHIYYHASVKAGADVAFARQVTRGGLSTNFTGNLDINLAAKADLYLAAPSYTFAERFLGGQATLALAIPYGRALGTVDAVLTGNLGLGFGGFTIGGSRTDVIDGFGDIAPMFNVRWNNGVHNVMTYVTGNLTTGRYDPTRLANLGIGHNAIDVGGAYSYFDPTTGLEFSSLLGFTYNFENVHTQYQNGVDMHFDWGASRFVTKQLQLGLVGYVYQQLSCDTGAGNRVGCFESRVLGVGPQIGYVAPVGTTHQAYFNLKGYKEFEAEHRASGWNVWFTLAISPAAPAHEPPAKAPRVRK
jgi:hypothetical protein